MSAKTINVESVKYEESSVYGDDAGQAKEDRRELDMVREKAKAAAGGIQTWLSGTMQEEVESGDSNSGGSEGGVPETTAVAYAVSELRELAKRVQRISRQQLAAVYRKGRAVYSAERRDPPARMKQYSLTGSRSVLELEKADGIYDELNAETRVVCQVTARTAIGKTTRFPAIISTRCKRRVLLLEPRVVLARAAADRQRGMTKIRTAWSRARTPLLTTMTYHDFVGHFQGQNGLDMLACFDVIMLDEADREEAAIYAAKTLLATFARDCSIIVMSATIDDGDLQATGKPVSVNYTTTSLKNMIDKGHVTRGAVGKDRTMIIATDDQEVQYVAGQLTANGYDAIALDSASRPEDNVFVTEFLSATSAVVNRYLVVSPEYGYGVNFAAGNLVTSGQKRIEVMSDDRKRMRSVVVPCTDREIKQQVARVTRGMTDSAAALVCIAPEEVNKQYGLSVSENLRYYVTMIASHVIPTRELTESVKGLLPFGLTQQVAVDLLAVNLPIEVAIRFFAADGRVPYKYAAALTAFSENHHDFMTSEHDEPHGRERWVEDTMSGYYEQGNNTMPKLSVPCFAEGNVKVAIHAICAVGLGLMEIEDWAPSFEDSDVSDTEVRQKKRESGPYLPRLIMERTPVRSRKLVMAPYSYDVPVSDQYAPRSRTAIMPGAVPVDILADLARFDTDDRRTDFSISCEISEFVENDSNRIGIVYRPREASTVDIHSPGGSIVMAFREEVWKKMANGETLDAHDAKSFFRSVRNNVEGFVDSDAFSGWTDVWLSIFRTAGDINNLQLVKDMNYTVRVIALVVALVTRYVRAVNEVARRSVIKAGFLSAMLRTKDSYQRIYERQSARGRTEIAQSEAFMRRVFMIRDVMVEALMQMEMSGIFMPNVVTQLQGMLPVMQTTGVKLFDKPSTSARYFRLLR